MTARLTNFGACGSIVCSTCVTVNPAAWMESSVGRLQSQQTTIRFSQFIRSCRRAVPGSSERRCSMKSSALARTTTSGPCSPGCHCRCPHWGYVVKGQMTVRYGDREEVIGGGEAFYLAPGHAPAATAGTEFIQISPTAQLQEVEVAIVRAMQQMQGT
jgi:mannose-6-phosphate isomerase-like protein (cupin superfamily)